VELVVEMKVREPEVIAKDVTTDKIQSDMPLYLGF
jgi:hypothetical protein